MRHYRQDNAVFRKEDASPVTEADREADKIIVARLREIAPDIPTVSEEGEKPDISQVPFFWLIDPLDGTKSFIRGSGYFTVNIALVNEEARPILGVIYDPVHEVMYWGSEAGAYKETKDGKERLQVSGNVRAQRALVSHSHINQKTEAYLAVHGLTERIPCASSIKFCLLAEGSADIYPRFGPTMEWDIAAGHAILEAAGGTVLTPEGTPFLYRKQGFLNGDFIAYAYRL